MSSNHSEQDNSKKSMDPQFLTQQQRHDILQTIYESSSPRHVFSLCVTGGGAEVIPWLLTVPGSSHSFMDCIVPYSRHSLSQFMKPPSLVSSATSSGKPNNVTPLDNLGCNEETAINMAKQSYQSAMNSLLAEKNQFHTLHHTNVFGIACTAALVSKQPKKGFHRCHVACYDSKGTITSYSYILKKGLRLREEEDKLCSNILFQAIYNQCHQNITTEKASKINFFPHTFVSDYDINTTSNYINSSADTHLEIKHEEEDKEEVLYQKSYTPQIDVLETLYQNQTQQILYIPRTDKISSSNSGNNNRASDEVTETVNDDNIEDDFLTYADLSLPTDTLVYPGSFNPLHEGHVALVAAALRLMAGSSRSSGDNDDGNRSRNNSNLCSNSVHSPVSSPSLSPPPLPPQFTHSHPIVIFEIAAVNADKPPLSREIVLERIRQFHPRHVLGQQLHAVGITNYGVAVTSKPLFIQKSECFNHCVFVIGADTFSRLIDSKYYYTPPNTTITTPTQASSSSADNQQQIQLQQQQQMMISQLNMASALTTIVNNGCRFIVGGRKRTSSSSSNSQASNSGDSKSSPQPGQQQQPVSSIAVAESDHSFQTLTDLTQSLQSLPNTISTMFIGLTEEQFRVDVSSTEIRQRRLQQLQQQQKK